VQQISCDEDGLRIDAWGGYGAQVASWRLDSRAAVPNQFVPTRSARTVVYSADGRWGLVDEGHGPFRLWDVSGNRLVREVDRPTFDEPLREVSLQVSPNQACMLVHFAAGQWAQHTVGCWDLGSGRLRGQHSLRHEPHVRPSSLLTQFDRTGRRLLVRDLYGAVTVWATANWQALPVITPPGVEVAALSPDGELLVTADRQGGLRAWDLEHGRERTWAPSAARATGVQIMTFDREGGRLLTGGGDAVVRVWDVASGEPLAEPLRHGGGVGLAQFSPDERRVLTVCSDGTARVWDVRTGTPVTPPLRDLQAVTTAAWASEGRRVLTLARGGSLRVWDLSGVPACRLLTHATPACALAFSPDGRRLATGAEDGTAQVWDVETGRPTTPLLGHAGPIAQFAWDAASQRIATSAGAAARVWDVRNGQPVTASLGRHVASGLGISQVALDPVRPRLALQFSDRVNLFDLERRRDVLQLQHEGDVAQMAFSPEGRWFAAANHHHVLLWQANSGELRHQFQLREEQYGTRLVFAAGGQRLVLEHPAGIQAWDTASGATVLDWRPGSGGFQWVRLSGDGARALTVNAEHACQVWDVGTGQPLGPQFHLGGGCVFAAPDEHGQRVVTVRADGEARVWDGRTGEPLTPPLRHGGPVIGAALSPDGRRLAVAGRDAAVCLWPLPEADPRPVEELSRQVHVLAAQQVAANGELGLAAAPPAAEGFVPTQPDADPLAWHDSQAQDSLQAGQWAAAVFHLDRLLAGRPDQPERLRQRAEAQGRRGRTAEALADLARLLETRNENGDRLRRARLNAMAGRWADVLADARAAERPAALAPAAWQALAHLQLTQYDQAERALGELRVRGQEDYLQAVRLWGRPDPQSTWAVRRDLTDLLPEVARDLRTAKEAEGRRRALLHRLRGLIHALSDDWPAARSDFEEAARLAPDAESYRGLALSAIRRLDWTAALELAVRAHRLAPNDDSLGLLVAWCRLVSNQATEALADLDTVVASRPTDAEARALRGQVRLALRRFPEAIEDYTAALKAAGAHAPFRWYHERGQAFAQLGQWTGARDDFRRVAELAPGEAQSAYLWALTALRAGDARGYHDAAVQQLGQLNDEAPQVPSQRALANTAVWVAALGPGSPGLGRGAALMERVVGKERNSLYLNTLGAILVRAGRHEVAIAHLREAVALSGDGGTAWDWLFLAQAHQALGQAAKSRAARAQALDWLRRQEAGQLRDERFRGPLDWPDRAELEVLIAETDALLNLR
jgi:WD40 repeat protein/tetratricopeptide (TPR) repeat protein